MKRLLIPVLLFGLAAFTLPAQSNQLVDRMLEDEAADVADAAYMVLLSAGAIEESASTGDAVSYARQRGWLDEGTTGSEPITFGEFSYVLMEAHGEEGGLMYRMIPGPRYAGREVIFQNWTVERRTTNEEISGETALRILGNYLAAREAE
ncbi:MAG: hypothetical protein ACLFNP_05830 [Spirochaetaceae bacterium]